jgi:hypothetical protein
MSSPAPLSSLFQRLADAVLDLDEDSRYALRASLEALVPHEPPQTTITDRFGVWDISKDGDEVLWKVRSSDLSLREQRSWHAVPHSSRRPSADTIRLVLVGCSAAASYGHWFDFSLATALEGKLNAGCGQRRFEVIDLACVNFLWENCLATLRHAATLRPDLVVFFTGNNEAKSLIRGLESGQLRHLPSALPATFWETADVPAMSRALHRCLEDHFRTMTRRTVRDARELGVELVVVVPQYNLVDWQAPERVPVSLTGAQLLSWWEATVWGEAMLEAGDADAALHSFEAAIALDQEQCQRSLYGRARALTMLGRDVAEQMAAYIAARDAGMGPFTRGNPQITEGAAGVLRETLRELDVPFVDLGVLASSSEGRPPDRHFFLDYCHLTWEGIDCLARELGRVVLEETCTGKQIHDPDLDALAVPTRPDAKSEAMAAWVAAITNYHFGQSLEICAYWLRKALKLWPPVRHLLEFLSDNLCSFWRERFTIAWFQERDWYKLFGEKHFFFFVKFFYHARFDYRLVRLIDEIIEKPVDLSDTGLGQNAVGTLSDLEGQLYSLFFLDMRQGFVTIHRTWPRKGRERLWLGVDASEPVSRVDFPADGGGKALLTLELSGPPIAAGSLCRVLLNHTEIFSFEVDSRWRRHEVPIPAGILRNGINHLSFHWSIMTGLGDLDSATSWRRYINQYGYYPVAARIHTLRIQQQQPTLQPGN